MNLKKNAIPSNGSDSTPNLGLPIFVQGQNDKPSWYTDWNPTMSTIDENIGFLQTADESKSTELENIRATDAKQTQDITDLEANVEDIYGKLGSHQTIISNHSSDLKRITDDLIVQNTAIKSLQTNDSGQSKEIVNIQTNVNDLDQTLNTTVDKVESLEEVTTQLNEEISDLISGKTLTYTFKSNVMGNSVGHSINLPKGWSLDSVCVTVLVSVLSNDIMFKSFTFFPLPGSGRYDVTSFGMQYTVPSGSVQRQLVMMASNTDQNIRFEYDDDTHFTVYATSGALSANIQLIITQSAP